MGSLPWRNDTRVENPGSLNHKSPQKKEQIVGIKNSGGQEGAQCTHGGKEGHSMSLKNSVEANK